MNETLSTIKKRRSNRNFLPEKVQEHQIQAILEAGTFAPSAANQQPWHFTIIENSQLLAQMTEDLRAHLEQEGNPRFAQIAKMDGFSAFHHAPAAILVSGDETALLPHADCAAATQNMLLAAESLGLGSCWVNLIVHLFAGKYRDKWKERLSIPKGYNPLYCVALGQKGAQSPPASPRRDNTFTFVS